MRAVGIKVLKNKLSEYLRLVAAGETVLVTDRDRVVAELVPPQPSRSPHVADAFMTEAVRTGLIAPPALPDRQPPPRLPVAAMADLMTELGRDRGER